MTIIQSICETSALNTGHLFELLGTQLDPELTLTTHCSNLPEWALPTLTTSDCSLSLIHSSHRGQL